MKPGIIQTLPRQESPLLHDCSWDDVKWAFPVTTAGAHSSVFTIDWNVPIGNKTLLHPEFAHLLYSWRFILWVFTSCPPDGKPRKGSYCSKFSTALRFILPWMAENNINDFSGLNKAGFQNFIERIRNHFSPSDSSQHHNDNATVTDVTVSTYLTVFQLPYLARAELENAGLASPESDPLQGQTAFAIAKTISKLKTIPTREIDDTVYVGAVNSAMDKIDAAWVEDAIKLNNLICELDNRSVSAHVDRFLSRYPTLRNSHPSNIRAFRNVVWELRVACQIILLSTSAIRVSEMCGITCSDVRIDSSIPSSITVERCFDDTYEIFLLHARLFKDTPSSEDVDWVLGMRPVGSSYRSPPVVAVDILERLDHGWRALSGHDRLLIQFSTAWLPTAREDVVVASSATVRVHTADWIRMNVHASADVSPHMWRKTFARYLIRVSAELLPAISRHMKHMTVSLTERGYCQGDSRSREIIRDARVQEAVSLVFGLISGERQVAGPASRELLEFARSVTGRSSNRSRQEAEDDVRQSVQVHKRHLYGMDFGYCVFQESAARCHNLSDTGVPLFARLAPAFHNQRAEICSKCSNFTVASEHMDYWRARHRSLVGRRSQFTGNEHPSLVSKIEQDIEKCDAVLKW